MFERDNVLIYLKREKALIYLEREKVLIYLEREMVLIYKTGRVFCPKAEKFFLFLRYMIRIT